MGMGGVWEGKGKRQTFSLFEHAVHGAGAAAARHGYGEFVVVRWGRHFWSFWGVGSGST